MKITGYRLKIVRDALELASGNLRAQVEGCVDVDKWAKEIANVNEERAVLEALVREVEESISHEQGGMV